MVDGFSGSLEIGCLASRRKFMKAREVPVTVFWSAMRSATTSSAVCRPLALAYRPKTSFRRLRVVRPTEESSIHSFGVITSFVGVILPVHHENRLLPAKKRVRNYTALSKNSPYLFSNQG